MSVCFSPKGGCTEAIVKELDEAKASILVQAYSFTSAPIAKGLVAAHERGVKVEVILDKSNLTEKYTNAPFLEKSGIPIKIDSAHAFAHNKAMIIDGGEWYLGPSTLPRLPKRKTLRTSLSLGITSWVGST